MDFAKPSAYKNINDSCFLLPQVTLPQVTLPQVTLPQVTLPQDALPQVTLPQDTLPHGQNNDYQILLDKISSGSTEQGSCTCS